MASMTSITANLVRLYVARRIGRVRSPQVSSRTSKQTCRGFGGCGIGEPLQAAGRLRTCLLRIRYGPLVPT